MQSKKLSQHLLSSSTAGMIRHAPAAKDAAQPTYEEGCLIRRLVAGKAPFALPSALCCAEPDLVMQVRY